MDSLDDFMMTRPPTANRPLLGLTVLAVEDSRFASEALRLLCQRSGARIRRADSLHHARRHLQVYRPSVVIVDLGLPDGSGAQLISDLAQASARVDVLLGTSGDPDGHHIAIKAGADGFLAKPIHSLDAFQAAILEHLPAERQPKGLRVVSGDRIDPDRISLRDDLTMAAAALDDASPRKIGYLTQFLGGVARSAEDTPLCEAVTALEQVHRAGGSTARHLARLSALVKDRIARAGVI